jgi:hypothetical protein
MSLLPHPKHRLPAGGVGGAPAFLEAGYLAGE